MLHSIYDLTTSCRKTSGDVPAKLVGASTTVVGSKMYLFGGRLVTERRMVSDLYVFDLESFVWERIKPFPEDDVPQPRYFHSADAWNNQLIIFGGMSNQPDSHNPDELCVLNDVRFFDLSTRRWIPSSQFPTPVSDTFVPRARYAHLSSVTADRLFIIGGQDFFNTWLDDICVYDLLGKTWVQRRDYPRHCGTYRSVAVASNLCVRRSQDENRDDSSSKLGTPGTRFRQSTATPTQSDFTTTESLVRLPYSTVPTEEHPSDIYLYSNYNFTDVKRELEVFSPLPDTDFTIQERSSSMLGTTFPPGLRFPTGAILGTHLIIAGTYLAHTYQSFSIWVLDLISMTWSRIDPGKAVETGSWFRGCLWGDANKFLIFGNRNGNLVDDYNRRLLSWDHVAVVDLEAFGIYQPPPLKLGLEMQEVGLAALEEGVLADFEIVCEDGRTIACSRKLLEDRWPWFKEHLQRFLHHAANTSAQLPNSPMHVENPALPGVASDDARPDPRLTARTLHLSEPYPITLALVRYFYTLALLTPLQLAPAVLSQLLVLSTTYQITHLESLVKHAMHRALSNSTSVGVYEVATLCGCRSLQIRALRTVMSYTQKKPASRRSDKENGSGGRPPDGGSSGGPPSANDSSGEKFGSRPRGTSDARWRMTDSDTNGHNSHTHSHHIVVSPPDPQSNDDHDRDHEASPSPGYLTTELSELNHRASTVSIGTDQELWDVAGLIQQPTINGQHARPNHSRPRSDPEDYVDVGSSADHSDSGDSDSSSHPPTPSAGSPSLLSKEVEHLYEMVSPDGRVERVYLPPDSNLPGLPGFHLPFNSPRGAYTSDGEANVSDVPSLISSRTSRSSIGSSKECPPLTPQTIVPPEYTHYSDSSLAIIEEKRQEEHSINGHAEDTTTQTKMPPRLNSINSSLWSLPPDRYPPPPSPTYMSPTSPSRISGISRLLRRDKSMDNFSQIAMVAGMSFKGEDKKKKKDAAWIKTERLAQDLKKREEARKRKDESVSSGNSSELKKESDLAMYGGMSGFTM